MRAKIYKLAGIKNSINRIFSMHDNCKKNSPVSDNCCVVRVLSLQPDFLAQKPLVKEVIESRGHKVIFTQSFIVSLILLKCFGVQLSDMHGIIVIIHSKN